ncbi:MAG: hypothetical protein R3281_12945 [Balneolaceae bacterium]|nr:hypothetical protein [Balneolaceae bacterium]
MTQEDKLYPLELYIEKFDEINRSGFVQNWLDDSLKLNINIMEDKAKKQVPNIDEVKSFILDFRFFVQDREPCSLRNLHSHYQKLSLPSEIVNDFQKQRDFFNTILDQEVNFGKQGKGNYTFGDIFWSYFYGQYAHSNNPEKRKKVKEWKETNFMESVTGFHFLCTLYNLFFVLKRIRNINIRAIEEIKSQ